MNLARRAFFSAAQSMCGQRITAAGCAQQFSYVRAVGDIA